MYNTKMSMKNAQMFADKVVRIGYCDLYYLLNQIERSGYNCGVYGWNCDIYRIYTTTGKLVVITTGYRNMRGESVDWEKVKHYNDIAKAVSEYKNEAYISDYNERKQFLTDLLDAFCRDICGEIEPDTSDIDKLSESETLSA